MTLKEATEAAERCAPVTHNGIEYTRITEAGYQYDANGKRSPFVQLLDRCVHSVTSADPLRCDLKEEQEHEAE